MVFFNQVFRDGFFHADMHPGNMLIDADGRIVALDFGIMGRIDLATRRHLAEILVGFLSRDYERVAAVFFSAGFVPPQQDQAAFQQACRAIGEPILDLPLNEISIGRLLGQLLTVAEQFEMQQQPQLVLLQKTMAVSEGVGRALNPNVNIWQVAQPLVEGWIRQHLGPEAQARRVVGDGVADVPGPARTGHAPGTADGRRRAPSARSIRAPLENQLALARTRARPCGGSAARPPAVTMHRFSLDYPADLRPLVTGRPPGRPNGCLRRSAHCCVQWVEPKLVAEVRYQQ